MIELDDVLTNNLSVGDMYETIGLHISKFCKGKFFKNSGYYDYIVEYSNIVLVKEQITLITFLLYWKSHFSD